MSSYAFHNQFIARLQERLEACKERVVLLTLERDELLSALQIEKERTQVMIQQIADLHRELVNKK